MRNWPDSTPPPHRRVIAFAGCAKTTTLRAIAAAHPGRRFLYVCFNNSVAVEARAADPLVNTTAATIHALAHKAVVQGSTQFMEDRWKKKGFKM